VAAVPRAGFVGEGDGVRARLEPVVVVIAVHQLEARCNLPIDLPEDAVFIELPWEPAVRAGLAFVVPLVLVASKEPQSVFDDRAREMGGEIAVAVPHEPALALRAVAVEPDGLARKVLELAVVGRVEPEVVSSLPAHDVEDRPLQVAVFRRGAQADDLDLLDDVGVDPGDGPSTVGAGEIGAVHQIGVLVRPRAKSGDTGGGDVGARGGTRRRHSRGRVDEVEHAEAATGVFCRYSFP